MSKPIFNIEEALRAELEKAGPILLYACEATHCHICGSFEETRAGVCWDCKDRVRTDLVNAWDVKNPSNHWPYAWREGAPKGFHNV